MFVKYNMFNLRLRTILNGIINNKHYLQACQCAQICTNKCGQIINTNALTYIDFKFSHFSKNVIHRTFSHEPLPKNKDTFGDLSYNYHRKVEMDQNEEAEEKFTENESQLPLRYRKTAGQYADIIKSHLEKMDLEGAKSVLELAKSNRDKPTVYMFNLIIRAYAMHGDMNTCFKLYNRMKKYGLKPNDATYTSLINSIANYNNTDKAMKQLYYLRKMFLEQKVVLNPTHYNALIMAYGKHKKVKEAFTMVDELTDNKISCTLNTFNVLLMCAVSQKNGGLKLSLILWHMIKRFRIQPDIKTYNLFLRCMRDTDFGNLKVNDLLLKDKDDTRIQYLDSGKPNLLTNPPMVTDLSEIIQNEKINSKTLKKPKYEPKVDTNILCLENIKNENSEISLSKIHSRNKLILFGGIEYILNMMEKDGVKPDVKTMTYLIELSPNSVVIEDMIISKANKLQIPLDVTFFNILMKKRCYRHAYDSARNVLKDMEKFNLFPDTVTWGTLALTCDTPADIKAFLESMKTVGFEPSNIIFGILLVQISRSKRIDKFETMIDLMKQMMYNEITPSHLSIQKMDNFQRSVKQMIKEKNIITKSIKFKQAFMKFCKVHDKWRSKFGPTKVVHES